MPDFIQKDPVRFPRRYSSAPDIEIAAFLAAAIAWGRRDLILKSAEKMFALMGKSPHAFIMEGEYKKLKARTRGTREDGGERRNIHRTFFEDDLFYFCEGFRACYKKYGSLEALFASGKDVWEGMGIFRETMAKANGAYSKHLAGPGSSSACKRLNLALRWLVRNEGPVDMGLWKSIPPAALFIPLDLHVGRAARYTGLLDPGRKANDRKAVVAITEKLREFCPEDPVKYDFSLFAYPAR